LDIQVDDDAADDIEEDEQEDDEEAEWSDQMDIDSSRFPLNTETKPTMV
jgi:hypothetical protein